MGCQYSKENQCYSLTCCFCMTGKAACYWIGIVSLVWESFGQCFDYLTAYSEYEYCHQCIDHYTNTRLSLASGIISSGQWVMSILLIIGSKRDIRFLVLLWLVWTSVTLVMLFVWFFYTMPYMPNVRGMATIIKLFCVIHYFIVIKTHYSEMSLSFTAKEETSGVKVPPNSPIRRSHKRRKIRVDPNHQPVIRTLLAVALKLKTYKDCKSIIANDELSRSSNTKTQCDKEENTSAFLEAIASPPTTTTANLEARPSQKENCTLVHQPFKLENCRPQDELLATPLSKSNDASEENKTNFKSDIPTGEDSTAVRLMSYKPKELVLEEGLLNLPTTTSELRILHMQKKRVSWTAKGSERHHQFNRNNPLRTLSMQDLSTGTSIPCVPEGRKSDESDFYSKSAIAIKRRKSYKVAVGHVDVEQTAADEERRILHVTDL
ncbi:uncharacterized protein [Palaemon carinicauda]|uniref:uncharacterized protein isoform X2 n=1 Tax=Palaemon carinicauda TaxID=392227 RepID=UPI0035B68AA4